MGLHATRLTQIPITLTIPVLLATQLLAGQGPQAKPVFSTTVFGSPIEGSGFRGLVYDLPPNTSRLPDFAALAPVATLYTKALNIPPQSFLDGVAGVQRVEWFAIDYQTEIWISKKGKYHFEIVSDDGTRLYMDEKQLIENDGQHPPKMKRASVTLQPGKHSIRVSYFQGPRDTIALVLKVKAPDTGWRLFNTDDFRSLDSLTGSANR